MSKMIKVRAVTALVLLFGVSLPFLMAQQPSTERPRRVEQQPPQHPPQTAPANSDDDVVRVDTNLTNVLLTAVDKDKHFYTGLGKDDLVVYENGARQEIFTFQKETNLPLRLVLLIDVTQSQENTLGAEKAAAGSFIDAVLRTEGDRISVASFAHTLNVQQDETNQRAPLHDAVERMSVELPTDYTGPKKDDPGCEVDPVGCSFIWDSVAEAVNRLLAPAPAQARGAIILLSDGDDTASKLERDQVAKLAIKNDTVIYSIGIGDRQNYPFKEKDLRELSEKTGGRAFFPNTPEDLNAAFAQIQDELRSQYLLAYAPLNGARDGSYRKIRIEPATEAVKKRKLRLLYREGYYAKQN
jgi:VWFA-related protein